MYSRIDESDGKRRLERASQLGNNGLQIERGRIALAGLEELIEDAVPERRLVATEVLGVEGKELAAALVGRPLAGLDRATDEVPIDGGEDLRVGALDAAGSARGVEAETH